MQTPRRTELVVGGETARETTDRMQLQTKWAPPHLDGVLKNCFLEKEGLTAPPSENSSKRQKNDDDDVVVVVVVHRQRTASSWKNALVRLSGR